jgi:DNA topoisomerase I
MALKLLSLPREVGRHPEDGEPILAGIGRFGAYVQHGKTYANVEAGDDVLNIGLNRAVTLIADKIAKGPRGRRFGGDPGRSLGDHPDKGGAVVVKAGRYGPYVSHDGINATLPKDKTPETITLAEALPLLAARAEQVAAGGGRRPARKGKAAKPAPAGEKPAKAKKNKDAKPAEPDVTKPASAGKKAAKPVATKPIASKPAKPVKSSAKNPAPLTPPPKRAKAGK